MFGFAQIDVTLDAFHPRLIVAVGCLGLVVVAVFALLDRRTARIRPGQDVGAAASGRLTLIAVAAIVVLATQDRILWIAAIPIVVLLLTLRQWAPDPWRAADDSLVGILTVISLVGVWAAVPDTEPALILGGVLAPSVLFARCRSAERLDRIAGITLVAVAAVTGSAGRSEIVGGLMCVGLLFLPPGPARSRRTVSPAIIVVHLAIVVVASRIVTRIV